MGRLMIGIRSGVCRVGSGFSWKRKVGAGHGPWRSAELLLPEPRTLWFPGRPRETMSRESIALRLRPSESLRGVTGNGDRPDRAERGASQEAALVWGLRANSKPPQLSVTGPRLLGAPPPVAQRNSKPESRAETSPSPGWRPADCLPNSVCDSSPHHRLCLRWL